MQATKPIVALALGVLLAFAPTGGTALAGEASAEGECRLDSVVVSAQKRTQEAADVPMSMTVIEDVDIQDMGIQGTGDLAIHVPNLEFNDFGSRRHGLMFMRGIKSIPTGEPSTGYYVDGVNYSKSYMFNFPLFDVERVEVLKGPQGTLYGRNSQGGVINVITKQPGEEYEGSVAATYGSYDRKEVRASASGPVFGDKLFMGLYGLVGVEDGYTENDADGDEDDDGRHRDGKAGRMKLRWLPTDDLDVNVTLDAQRHDDGAYPARRTERNALVKAGTFGADEPFHYSHDFESEQENDCWGTTLDATYRTGFGELSSVTGYRDYESDEHIDGDFSPLDRMRKHWIQQERDWSQEFRLASPKDESPISWVVGTYLFSLEADTEVTNLFGSATGTPGKTVLFDTERTNTGAALFGQVDHELVEGVDLTLGLRLEHEHAEAESKRVDTTAAGVSNTVNSIDESQDFSAALPKLALAWHPVEDCMLYASVAGAHRSGGFNDASAPTGKETFSEEHSWQYEAGVKSQFLDNRLLFNVAVFHISIEDEQLPLFDATTLQNYTANAGRSHRLGVEAETRFMVVEGLELSASYSWIEAEYDSYNDTDGGVDYGGNQVFCVPEYTYALGASYRHKVVDGWDAFGRVDLAGTGSRYFDDANTVKGAEYELVNLRLGIEGEHLDCHVWAKNLLDEEYVVFENVAGGFAEDGAPRTVGVTVTYRF